MKKLGAVKKKRFSLVELLVVVSVIAVLAGLILPAISSAKNKVKQSACLSNLRQIGQGAMGYVNDYNHYVIPCKLTLSVGIEVNFMNYLYNTEVLKSEEVFKCSSVTDDFHFYKPSGYASAVAPIDDLQHVSYVMNNIKELSGAPGIPGVSNMNNCKGWGIDSATSIKITKVKSFSTKLYLMDGIKRPDVVTGTSGWNSDMQSLKEWKETDHGEVPTSNTGNGEKRDVGYHHMNGSFSVLLGDMHASKRRISQAEEWVVWIDE